MITVPEVVENIIKASPFLEEGISRNLINLSALAREMQPTIERELFKEVSEASIIMALNRFSEKTSFRMQMKKYFKTVPDMIVRSHLSEYTFQNSESLIIKQRKLLDHLKSETSSFFTMTRGVFETTIIASDDLKNEILKTLEGEKVISQFDKLSSITIRLAKEVVDTPGVYYYILKLLAWDNINVIEVVSAYTEFTVILRDKEVDRAFSVLKNSVVT